MMSSLRRASCRYRLSSRRSSLTSMSSWTRATPIVKPTDISRRETTVPRLYPKTHVPTTALKEVDN